MRKSCYKYDLWQLFLLILLIFFGEMMDVCVCLLYLRESGILRPELLEGCLQHFFACFQLFPFVKPGGFAGFLGVLSALWWNRLWYEIQEYVQGGQLLYR